MLRFHTILHPTDFSPAAEYAFRIAAALAHDHGGRMIVLHVNPPAARTFGEAEDEDRRSKEKLWDEFQRLEALDPDFLDQRIDTRFVDGDPVEEIVCEAEDAGCDLIVMGTHGRGGLSRLLMGSVAEQVMRRACCPVMTVKPFLKAEPASTAPIPEAVQV